MSGKNEMRVEKNGDIDYIGFDGKLNEYNLY